MYFWYFLCSSLLVTFINEKVYEMVISSTSYVPFPLLPFRTVARWSPPLSPSDLCSDVFCRKSEMRWTRKFLSLRLANKKVIFPLVLMDNGLGSTLELSAFSTMVTCSSENTPKYVLFIWCYQRSGGYVPLYNQKARDSETNDGANDQHIFNEVSIGKSAICDWAIWVRQTSTWTLLEALRDTDSTRGLLHMWNLCETRGDVHFSVR